MKTARCTVLVMTVMLLMFTTSVFAAEIYHFFTTPITTFGASAI